ncbi:helix-turn-helix domain-containing protein [Emticicia sp. CRIBPO]|uniref:IclR family transcriptional regulator n=1 Tax=Emticicia sp. CRIBPO TaxID=2683258 RepID=UPI001412EC47|nr:IclR family transcriptional regulator C-terminal domain-containing protein [Emticicia sp. CRIBPO]NBA85580.1 helix-turn-helix domain-containing protein [Emticicia sp. CRIBPO]
MIQVINRALDILEYIAVDPERPKTLSEIADKLELNHGTCANILKTLVGRQYVEQVGTKKGYLLSIKSYALTENENYRKHLIDASKPVMDDLTERLNENFLLAVINGNLRVAIYRTFADQDLQVRTAVEKNIYDSASGRLIVAMFSENELERYTEKYGLPSTDIWPEADTHEKFRSLVEVIKKQGYAIQTSVRKQVVGIAVPVYKDAKVIASLSIYMPEYRFMNADKTDIIKQLVKGASDISKRI